MSQYTQSIKRTYGGRDTSRGKKFIRGGAGRSSFHMVANSGSSDLSDMRLKLPATREQWLTVEQQIRAVAVEKELLPILEGTYVEKPLYPLIPMKKWAFEYEVVPIDPTNLAGGTKTIPKLDPNGERIILTDALTGERMVEAEYVSETGPHDFSKSELVKLHQEKQRNDDKTSKMRAMTWTFLMKITETHHRDLIIPFAHKYDDPTQARDAWTAIKGYYEGLTIEDRRVHLDSMWLNIPKIYKELLRRPTMREVNNLVSSIGALRLW